MKYCWFNVILNHYAVIERHCFKNLTKIFNKLFKSGDPKVVLRSLVKS